MQQELRPDMPKNWHLLTLVYGAVIGSTRAKKPAFDGILCLSLTIHIECRSIQLQKVVVTHSMQINC